MATFRYFLQKPNVINSKGVKMPNPKESRLYMAVIIDRLNVSKLKTEYRIKATEWNFNEQKIKHQVTGSVEKNQRLEDLRKQTETEYLRLRTEYPSMPFKEVGEQLKTYILHGVSPVYAEKNKPFFQVYDAFLEAKSYEVSESTMKKFRTLKSILWEYKPGTSFDQVNKKYIDGLKMHFQQMPARGRQKTRGGNETGLLNDTQSKYLECLKNFLRWSHEMEYNNNMYFEKISANVKSKRQRERGKNDIVTLHLNELMHLYEYDFSGNTRLERVRDLFVFMCFSLQRWSDAAQFNKEQLINIPSNGGMIKGWKFNSIKTGKQIIIPLVGDYIGNALMILKKYNYQLPQLSEQKFNSYIKEAAKVAGLDREKEIRRSIGNKDIVIKKPLHDFLSSHCGRRTGISLLLNKYGVSLHKVRDLSGHSDLKTLDKYLDKDTQSIIAELETARDTGNIRTLRTG